MTDERFRVSSNRCGLCYGRSNTLRPVWNWWIRADEAEALGNRSRSGFPNGGFAADESASGSRHAVSRPTFVAPRPRGRCPGRAGVLGRARARWRQWAAVAEPSPTGKAIGECTRQVGGDADCLATATSTGGIDCTRRRARLRSRGVAAGLLMTMAVLFAELAEAHTTLVSNVDQGSDLGVISSERWSQRFTTGPNSRGYRLSSVVIPSEGVQVGSLSMSVCTVSHASPNGDCIPLQPADHSAADVLTFVAPPNAMLEPGTEYAVVAAAGGRTLALGPTTSDREDSDSAFSWTIAHSVSLKNSGGTWETRANQSLRLTITGDFVRNTGQSLVSNLDQGNDSFETVRGNWAQPFFTGPHSQHYELHRVDVLSEDSSGDPFSVKVCSAKPNGTPAMDACKELDAPSSFAAGVLSFTYGYTERGARHLRSNKAYVVVIDTGANVVRLDATASDGEDSEAASGWRIGAFHYTLDGDVNRQAK